ncbi:hypothetical protein TWF730_007677 [Orbilia blumenaviensis]|uniref:G domain-containing protein n=1 Tax=Orbilia blumenaviensis TaxID=1796055 RepID=A0AAV9VB36_9PEZI
MEDQTRPRAPRWRRFVPNLKSTETEGVGGTIIGTETMSSQRSFPENSRVKSEHETSGLGSAVPAPEPKPTGTAWKFEKYNDVGTVRPLIVGAIVVVLGILWSMSSFKSGPVAGLTPSSPIIAIMGETGAGKSSFIKALGGRNSSGAFPKVGHTLNSTTKEVAWYSAVVGSKGFYMLDTPGFDDSYMSDFEILEGLTKELAAIYNSARPLTGIIYVHDVSKEKMGGTSHKSLRTFQKLVGEQSMQNIVLVTTHWRRFFNGDQVKREQELQQTFWGYMIRLGSKILRHDGSRKSAERIVKEILDRKPVVVKIVDEMVNKKMKFGDTDAGGVVTVGLKVLEGKLDSNMAFLNDEITRLKKDKEDAKSAAEERMRELEERWKTSSQKEKQNIEEQMEKLKGEAAKQAKLFNEQLTIVVHEKQQLRYQINDLKKANESLRRRLDEQIQRQKAAEEERKKKEEEGSWVLGLIGVVIWIFGILFLIGLCCGGASS